MARAYDLIIFDWDGTLMDSAAHIVAAMQQAIADLKLPHREPEQMRELIGLGLNDVLSRLFPELELEALKQLLQSYRERFIRPPTAGAVLFEGVAETIEQLNQAGYGLAVATGKSRAGLDRELRETGLGRYFSLSRCADECPSKPHPQMLEEILAESGVPTERTVMVGDTEYDMLMAQAIQMSALGVGSGVHTPDRLKSHGALAVLPSVTALPWWLAKSG